MFMFLGKVNSHDHSVLSSKISDLSPTQYRHLEDIINSFLAAVVEQCTQRKSVLLFSFIHILYAWITHFFNNLE